MIIVDTSVLIDYFHNVKNAETKWLDYEVDKQSLALTDLNLCELLQGINENAEFQLIEKEMKRFEIFATGGEEMALACAKNYRILHKKGITPRKTIDCWIATFCLREGHSLLHRDRDFDAFEKILGLRVIHP